MRYYLEIDLDNGAFSLSGGPGLALAELLREIAGQVEGYNFRNAPTRFPIRDGNGNRVGQHGYYLREDGE